ncbi:MAG: YlxR family protein [Actinomycetia bacterium]|nr:YlxR family protein [Actinomycetes bacterium]
MTKRPAIRTCVACRQSRPRPELARIVRQSDGTVQLDRSGRLAGRGAYLCLNPDCFSQARRQHRLERALQVPINDQLYDQLAADFAIICRPGS